MKKLIEKYNNKESLLVISSYPLKGMVYGNGVGGVASFAKNNLIPLSEERKIVVLAEILTKPEIYEEGNILVCRIWRRNFPGIYFDLIKAVKKFSKIKHFEVQFEFSLFGELIITGFMPLFLGLLKLSGKNIVIVVHQVLLSLDSLSGHLGWTERTLKQKAFSIILRLYYYLLAINSNKIVVLEPAFKRRLQAIGIKDDKVSVIRLGVDRNLIATKKEIAMRELGIEKNEFVILVFGFLAWYKGSDLIAEAFTKLIQKYPSKKIKLILAGGESLTQKQKPHYQKYVKNLYSLAAKNSRITITGFVPEQKLKKYFGAADLVVLPYRAFMSSSAVLSLTLSFGKPLIISEELKGWFEGMEEEKNLPEFLFFKANVNSLALALEKIIFNRTNLNILGNFSYKLAYERDYQIVGKQYSNLWQTKEGIQKITYEKVITN
ncbi:hypothetical protein COT64_01855 [Candidatus Shapirobacteria bacterium CG09_land_8_20_14_0_10_39_12]|uniref:Glycosyl transferase family 1 domain-containing protein n=1 Tax=Candidatus Shapirobacteria bacterium CG09_land_8_20_14_0_10_39_12 TaxID=1974885 RepID=A0A2H0WPJ8_9BACT|nr:MAG: hypothetical protein COT64_01855 [Candidatus Shapirobacteria bacterium CG09_land_8_20_14_0_10_39_12]